MRDRLGQGELPTELFGQARDLRLFPLGRRHVGRRQGRGRGDLLAVHGAGDLARVQLRRRHEPFEVGAARERAGAAAVTDGAGHALFRRAAGEAGVARGRARNIKALPRTGERDVEQAHFFLPAFVAQGQFHQGVDRVLELHLPRPVAEAERHAERVVAEERPRLIGGVETAPRVDEKDDGELQPFRRMHGQNPHGVLGGTAAGGLELCVALALALNVGEEAVQTLVRRSGKGAGIVVEQFEIALGGSAVRAREAVERRLGVDAAHEVRDGGVLRLPTERREQGEERVPGGEIRVCRAVGAERLEERNVGVALPPDLGQRVRRHAAEGGAEDTREGNVEQGIVDDREERDGEQDLRALEEVFLFRQGDRNPVQRECADERREFPPQTAG